MSLVNQVLNRLEQRSADTALDQTQVRAVPPQAGYRWIKPMVLALVLLAVLATAAWLLGVSPKKTGSANRCPATGGERAGIARCDDACAH